MKFLSSYIATTGAFLLMDLLWLGLIAKSLYREGIGHLLAASPDLTAAAAFYVLFPCGLLTFAVLPPASPVAMLASTDSPLTRAFIAGALFGLFAYATYDLSNLATLKDWPLRLSLIDIAWGTVVSGLASVAGRWTLERLS